MEAGVSEMATKLNVRKQGLLQNILKTGNVCWEAEVLEDEGGK